MTHLHHKTSVVSTCIVGLLALGISASAGAQSAPDPTLWTDAFNPSGDEVVPVVQYDPVTGLMSVNTLGLNQADDTATNGNAIGGDDVGMISILITGPVQTAILLTGPQGTNPVGTDWQGQYFAGKLQLFGSPALDQYLLPIGTTDIAQYPVGLTAADFGQVEMGINFTTGAPGDTIFGSVQVLTDPTGACCVAGICTQETAADCAALVGVYGGDNIDCSAVICNDVCDGAIPIDVPSVTAGSTVGATIDPVPGAFCGTSITAPGVWYSVIGNGNCYTADTCSGTSYDSKISVFEGPCDALVCIDGDDDTCSLQSEITWNSVNGVEYLVLVHGFGGAVGTFDLTLSETPPAANDDVCDALPLDLEVVTPFSNECTSAQPGEVSPGAGTGSSSCDSQDGWCSFETGVQNSIWFTFIAPRCGCVSITTDGFDTQLAVWQVGDCGDFGSFVELAANDDGGPGLASFIDQLTGLTEGETYYVQIDGFSGASGTGTVLVQECPLSADCNLNCIDDADEVAPDYNPGDPVLSALDCSNAEYICPGITYNGATIPLAPGVNQSLFCGVFFGANDAFYRYRPTYSGQAYVSVQGPPLDWLIAVHADCPATGANQVACNQFATGAQFNAVAGQEYIIRVAAAGFAAGPFILTMTGPDCLPSVNDINQNGEPDDCDCLADVNVDGVVDMADYMAVLLAQGPCGVCPEDIDQSGVVDSNDLQLVLLNQGPCPFVAGPIAAPDMNSSPTPRKGRSI